LFGNDGAAAPTGHAPTPAPRPQRKPGGRDAEAMLHKELLAALGRRGLTALAHTCQHCGKLATADLTSYPEVRMACRDAVIAWWKLVQADVEAKTAEAKR